MALELPDDVLAERLARRTLALVDAASESRDEQRLADGLQAELAAAGARVRDAGDTCLVVEAGSEDPLAPLVLLAGHLDTVPAQGNRPGRREGGAVHGLGACDMKGAVAVMLELALGLRDATRRVAVVLFGREELGVADSALTPLLDREPGLREAALGVVMEPTANALHAGCLGNLNATWTFHGVAGHSARPWTADNAVVHAARGIGRLAEEPWVTRTYDGLEFTEVCSVTKIAGGVAENVIPDRVDCHVNFRYAPGRSAEEAEERLRELTRAPQSELAIHSNAPSGAVAVGAPLARQLIDVGGLEVAPKQAWTPVAELVLAGIDAINFGPGDPRFAHRRDEQVAEAALLRSARVLEAFLCA